MKMRQTIDNPDSRLSCVQTITPAGIELNPTTEPIDEPEKAEGETKITKFKSIKGCTQISQI